jgi:hypothetical protein
VATVGPRVGSGEAGRPAACHPDTGPADGPADRLTLFG